MHKMKSKILAAVLLTAATCACGPKDGTYTFELLTTNDVHGSWFDSTYVGGNLKSSLFAVNHYVDSIRAAVGKENVILVDAGDCLQGDNAAYYFNYVDTDAPHIYPRIAAYMGYDAVIVGNHDIETGHPVYDKIAAELKANGIPFLAGNAIRNDNGKPYFQTYTTIKRNGIKILILGFTNPNMKAWLTESLWSGMTFESLIPLVQQEVDEITAKEKPQVVVAAVHSGTGNGDGSMLESQGLDLYQSLSGVDFLICSHDHRPITMQKEDICLINSGSHARNIGHGTVTLTVKGGKVVEKRLGAEIIPVDPQKADPRMRDAFHKDFETVKAFTLREVGELKQDLFTRDSFKGMCDYMNLLHTLSLSAGTAEISFAAPLTFNGKINAGTLVYNDLFTLYPYENQLFVVNMSGEEIKNYLEYSYDSWIQTAASDNDHVLKIVNRADARNQSARWSFVGTTFNFDSAGGIVYTVDVTKPFGERISITSLADGTAFDLGRTYKVAMTSYRASGGGNLLAKGAGIDTDNIDERIVERFPEIRNILYNWLQEKKIIDSSLISDESVIGHWEFIPAFAEKAIARDHDLVFSWR